MIKTIASHAIQTIQCTNTTAVAPYTLHALPHAIIQPSPAPSWINSMLVFNGAYSAQYLVITVSIPVLHAWAAFQHTIHLLMFLLLIIIV